MNIDCKTDEEGLKRGEERIKVGPEGSQKELKRVKLSPRRDEKRVCNKSIVLYQSGWGCTREGNLDW